MEWPASSSPRRIAPRSASTARVAVVERDKTLRPVKSDIVVSLRKGKDGALKRAHETGIYAARNALDLVPGHGGILFLTKENASVIPVKAQLPQELVAPYYVDGARWMVSASMTSRVR